MNIADKYNHGAPKFKHQLPEKAPFKSLKELYNGENGKNTYRVYGVFLNRKGKFGDSPVAISEDFYINLPAFLCMDVKEMLCDNECIDAMNKGKIGFEIYRYTPKDFPNKECYSVRWVDL